MTQLRIIMTGVAKWRETRSSFSCWYDGKHESLRLELKDVYGQRIGNGVDE